MLILGMVVSPLTFSLKEEILMSYPTVPPDRFDSSDEIDKDDGREWSSGNPYRGSSAWYEEMWSYGRQGRSSLLSFPFPPVPFALSFRSLADARSPLTQVLVPISEHINRLVAMRLQCDIMGTTNLVVCRTDSEAATLLSTNIDPRDHSFILGSTNPSLPPLNDLMIAAEMEGKYGQELQKIEDAWTKQAGLKLWPDVLADALSKHGVPSKKIIEFREQSIGTSHASTLQLAQSFGLPASATPYWSWDTPRSREGYYRYQGGTQCAINRAIAFAPYADLLWMETKSPIYAQAKEFAEGVHKVHPGQWLAYNLSPSFNWEKAGLGKKEMKEYVWELGKLGFVFQFITVSPFFFPCVFKSLLADRT